MAEVGLMKFRTKMTAKWIAACGVVFATALCCEAQDVVPVSSATTFFAKGTVKITGTAQQAGTDVAQAGGKISTAGDGEASVSLGSSGSARMGPDTEIQIPAAQTKEHSLELLKGKLYLNISADELKKRKAGEFRLKTPVALLAVKGTKFFAISEKGADTIGVNEGSVSVTEPINKASVTLSAGQAVAVSQGQISAVRSVTDEERGYTVLHDEAELVRMPLILVLEKAVTGAPQSSAQLYANGKLWEYTDVQYASFRHRYWADPGNSKKGLPHVICEHSTKHIVPQLTVDGIIRYTWQYSMNYDDATKKPQKTVGLTYKVDYLIDDSPPFALQMRIRMKNLAKLTIAGTDVVIPSDGTWIEFQLPMKATYRLPEQIIMPYPLGPDKKGIGPRKDTAVLDITELVLLCQPNRPKTK